MEVPEYWEGPLRTRDLIRILEPQTKKQYLNYVLFEDWEIKGLRGLGSEKDISNRKLKSNYCNLSLNLDFV